MTATVQEASQPAAITQPDSGEWMLSGHWTSLGLGDLPASLNAQPCADGPVVLDGSGLVAIDSAGAWVLRRWLRLQRSEATLRDWSQPMQALMDLVRHHPDLPLPAAERPSALQRVGQKAEAAALQGLGLLRFVGQVAMATLGTLRHPGRIRVRAVLHSIQVDGFEALPIIGLTAFLLGVVVAYQGADQLKHYGANVFVVDLVGYAMLREFAPLISAIIIAGRSGSAYAAQIGTMVVTEEVDAMRTIAVDPIEMLVLPKLLGLALALPLLTVFADLTGVFGGMVMARSQLGIGFREFIDRFGREMQGGTLLLGIGKSLTFAVVIALIGCFQGFRTHGGADSVGLQTTRSVVQSIFTVIVADALFSVAFNVLGL